MTKKSIALYLGIIGFMLMIAIGWYVYALLSQPEPTATSFDGERAYADVQTQVAFGPRIPETDGHAKTVEWIREELVKAGWQVEIQESEALGHPIRNIVAKRKDASPQVILGAHYDTRLHADSDPDPETSLKPVPGANDGASGVAVLLELARTLPEDTGDLWLVFFDAEDNGRFEGWDWILGSREFVKNNAVQPRAVVIVDMIGDADLNIYKERNSNPELTDEIWAVAKGLGYEKVFIPEYKHSMLDDHTPFLEAGIPAVDIIDFDYPYWHTIEDTPDKVSAESLETVGRTLWTWVTQQSGQN
ncbi:MAG TPA: M28 family peptidase [Anaerolineales bacterium]|nr:M28 family peptidase [Anaerolineales bacterium]